MERNNLDLLPYSAANKNRMWRDNSIQVFIGYIIYSCQYVYCAESDLKSTKNILLVLKSYFSEFKLWIIYLGCLILYNLAYIPETSNFSPMKNLVLKHIVVILTFYCVFYFHLRKRASSPKKMCLPPCHSKPIRTQKKIRMLVTKHFHCMDTKDISQNIFSKRVKYRFWTMRVNNCWFI